MRIAFVSYPFVPSFPPSDSFTIWTHEVARRLVAEHEVIVYAVRRKGSPAKTLSYDGVDYRLLPAVPYHRVWRAAKRVSRLPGKALSSMGPRVGERRLGVADLRPTFASPLYFAGYHLRIARDLRRERFDVVHIHNTSQLVPLVRRASPKSTIALYMHNYWLTQLDREMIASRIAHADLLLSSSDDVVERVRRAFPEAAARCRTIHNGVDLDAFAQAMSERSGAQRNGSRLIAVGRLSPEKGLHVLLDAFDRIVEAHPRAELEIVGAEQMIPLVMLAAISEDEAVRSLAPLYRGSYEAELRRRLSERTESRVKFAGPVPHAAVAEHYRDADILVAPSFTESFGLPAAEAMAAGLPVVASGVGGLAEIVVDGETGFLVPPGDEGALAEAVLRLLGDVELRHRMGAAGRRRAEALFSWGRVAEELVRAYATA